MIDVSRAASLIKAVAGRLFTTARVLVGIEVSGGGGGAVLILLEAILWCFFIPVAATEAQRRGKNTIKLNRWALFEGRVPPG